jgi:anti-sigma factor RsiW
MYEQSFGEPSHSVLDRYVMERLSPSERLNLEKHLSTCARCSEVVAETRILIAAHLRAANVPQLPAIRPANPAERSHIGAS